MHENRLRLCIPGIAMTDRAFSHSYCERSEAIPQCVGTPEQANFLSLRTFRLLLYFLLYSQKSYSSFLFRTLYGFSQTIDAELTGKV